MSYYIQYRPQELEEVIGQNEAVGVLKAKLRDKNLPHVVSFIGPTGTGKSTLARIVANKLGCTKNNLTVVNCADVRGIDSVRELQESVGFYPMGGVCRVWILEEVVQLPKTTQQAFLQLLENVPEHCYFLLCTSDTSGLLPTFLGRLFVITLESLSKKDTLKIMISVCNKVKKTPDTQLLDLIANKAEGSARVAIQLLEAALTSDDLTQQQRIVSLSSIKGEEKAAFLATILMRRPPAKWDDIIPSLLGIEDKDAESIRRQILAYASKIMLSKAPIKQQAVNLIRAFKFDFKDSGRAGLIEMAWNICTKK